MSDAPTQFRRTPRQDDIGLLRIVNRSGMKINVLPSGDIFSIEHQASGGTIMINQLLGSPVAGGLGNLYLRVGGASPQILPLVGSRARPRVGAADDRFVWEGEHAGLRHHVTLWLHPSLNLWLWRAEISNSSKKETPCDVIFLQDLGLGAPGFVTNNEAYASQYLDHFISKHPRMGFLQMSRQNLSQGGAHPWAMHGCFEGAAGFATDLRQLMGPAYRDADGLRLPFGTSLPSKALQYETGCAALQSRAKTLAPGETTAWSFFGFFLPDHPEASNHTDLARIDLIEKSRGEWTARAVDLSEPSRTILHDADVAIADTLSKKVIRARYSHRTHVEQADGELLSFFVPGATYSRHVVFRAKERVVARRHGALLLTGEDLLPTEATLCATCWMHGVFGAQLTIGNTTFHKLFSVSRDPYNIARGNGLRMLMETKDGWRLLAVPSVFEMGLSDCRWIYQFGERTITVSALVASDEPAMQWRVVVDGEPCRLLAFGHLVLGEQEFAHAGRVEIDQSNKRFTFKPDSDGMWSDRYPQAVYHLVTSTPEAIEAVGGDELLYTDGKRRGGAYAVILTHPTNEFAFAVVGSMTEARQAEALASKYSRPVDERAMARQSARSWRNISRGIRVDSAKGDAEAKAIDTIFPWLVHDAMVHLRAPHGLEQYSGGAWGTRDVCQGPVELFLSLEHDEPVKEILRLLFSEQNEKHGDWPQWFMVEPYSHIRDKESHGDVIVWPLKALCDYIEATGDFALLNEPIAWRSEDAQNKTTRADPISSHIEKLVATIKDRFIPGTHLIRYGNGDWNDSLQPVDPEKRDWMASSWTVALLYQQLCRYAEILRRIGRVEAAKEQDALAAAMREDVNRFLIRDDTLAGYGVFAPEGRAPKLLIHPCDESTAISFSMFAMVQAIIGGVFTAEQARRHLDLIRNCLLFPDGARLMDKPIAYHGGPERIFRRAESAAFFGREIGLMYTHSHLRYAEAMSVLGEAEPLWAALLIANPIAVTDRLPHASLRQRNAYFSSSDAAFDDRYQASAEWSRVKAGAIPVDGGWRIYSSGPGLYANMLVQQAFGVRRRFGARIAKPCLPAAHAGLRLVWPGRVDADSTEIAGPT
jgi:cellobiose phosphorylase